MLINYGMMQEHLKFQQVKVKIKHYCKQCGKCCFKIRPECAKKNLEFKDGKYWCKLHGTDKFPKECAAYPVDGICEAMELIKDPAEYKKLGKIWKWK